MPGGHTLDGHIFYTPSGRVFRFPDAWYVLDWDGQEIRWERLMDCENAKRLNLRGFFERVGHAGFFGLSFDGRLYDENEGTWADLTPGLRGLSELIRVAPDGETLLVTQLTSPHKLWRVNLATRQWELVVSWDPPWDAALRQEALKFIRPRSLPRRFREIGRDDKGLVLVSRHACFRIQWNACQDRLRLKCLAGDAPAARRAFEPAAGPPGAGYTLNVARWEDGSRAWLDSRGLLHLQSSDSRLPEASLVLNPPFVSGWLSDGRRWGSPYFVGEHPRSPASSIHNEVLQPFVARLR